MCTLLTSSFFFFKKKTAYEMCISDWSSDVCSSDLGPEPEVLWKLIERVRVTHFGTSPAFAQIMQKDGLQPRLKFDLSALQMVLLAGSPAMPETFAWLYDQVKAELWVTSQSGGRSEEHTSELQSLMRISYAVFCLKKKTKHIQNKQITPDPARKRT